jgi:threonine aldolase
MIFSDEKTTLEQIYRTRYILAKLGTRYPGIKEIAARLQMLAESYNRAVFVTRAYSPTKKPALKNYFGLTRTYSNAVQVIEYKSNNLVHDIPLLAHEFTHACGGDELDARVTEILVNRSLGKKTYVPIGMLKDFARTKKGMIYSLDQHNGAIYYLDELLWTS